MIGRAATAAAAPTPRRGTDPLSYRDEEGDTGWLLPYVDVISLLLAFLILALAMSKVDAYRFELVSSMLARRQARPSLLVVKEQIDEAMRQQQLTGDVRTTLDEEGLRMEIRNALLFESGEAVITPRGQSAIDQVIALIPRLDQRYQIAIEGHTDDVPIHTARFDSNWDLSAARANNVLKSFLHAGVNPRRLSAQGYADTRPAEEPAAGLEGKALAEVRAENRRVVIRIY